LSANLLHQRRDARRELVRQQVGDPDKPSAVLSLGEDLRGCIVMCEGPVGHRPHQPAGLVIKVDEPLACDRAVDERHDSVVAVEARLGDESGCQPLVDGAPVTQCVPCRLGRRVDRDFCAD